MQMRKILAICLFLVASHAQAGFLHNLAKRAYWDRLKSVLLQMESNEERSSELGSHDTNQQSVLDIIVLHEDPEAASMYVWILNLLATPEDDEEKVELPRPLREDPAQESPAVLEAANIPLTLTPTTLTPPTFTFEPAPMMGTEVLHASLPPFPKPKYRGRPDATRRSTEPSVPRQTPLSREESLKQIREKIEEQAPTKLLQERKQSFEKGSKKFFKSCRFFDPHWSMYPDRILGDGAEGVVYLGQELHIGGPYAVKVLKDSGQSHKKNQKTTREKFQEEIRMLEHLGISILNFETEVEFGVFIPYEGIPLSNLPSNLAPELRYEIAIAFMKKMSWLHEMGVFHRDIKPRNVLVFVNPDGSLKVSIIDFGEACFRPKPEPVQEFIPLPVLHQTMVGTLAYQTPEALTDDRPPYDESADIYAMGLTLMSLLAEFNPESIAFQNEMQDALVRAYYGSYFGSFPSPNDYMHAAFSRFVELCSHTLDLSQIENTDPLGVTFIQSLLGFCHQKVRPIFPQIQGYLRTAFFQQLDLQFETADLSPLQNNDPTAYAFLHYMRKLCHQNKDQRTTPSELRDMIVDLEQRFKAQYKPVDSAAVDSAAADSVASEPSSPPATPVNPRSLDLSRVSPWRSSSSSLRPKSASPKKYHSAVTASAPTSSAPVSPSHNSPVQIPGTQSAPTLHLRQSASPRENHNSPLHTPPKAGTPTQASPKLSPKDLPKSLKQEKEKRRKSSKSITRPTTRRGSAPDDDKTIL